VKSGRRATPAHYAAWAIEVALASVLAACSPQLNWREVQLGRLSTLLPCKPDKASRPVNLGGQDVVMDMEGCQAGPALYAISRVQANDATSAAALMAALREATLANLGRSVVHPLANTGDVLSSFDVQVDGHRADGAALQARLKWLVAGQEVYQIAAYAEHLSQDQTDNLLDEVRIH
jgi:hypothetical protein